VIKRLFANSCKAGKSGISRSTPPISTRNILCF
jgi:hypothetical protein